MGVELDTYTWKVNFNFSVCIVKVHAENCRENLSDAIGNWAAFKLAYKPTISIDIYQTQTKLASNNNHHANCMLFED
jgi:regulatory protein YycH of two-component signal transduction system YycFG